MAAKRIGYIPKVLVQNQPIPDKACLVCERTFKPNSTQHKYCSPECKGRVQYITGYGSTENQYKRINYNWHKYLQRLVYSTSRKDLSVEYLLDLLNKQDYNCALSGVKMTCVLGKGMINFTNASVDRIVPGSEYKEGSIRLVCRIANVMKWNMQDSELKLWCQRILNYGT